MERWRRAQGPRVCPAAGRGAIHPPEKARTRARAHDWPGAVAWICASATRGAQRHTVRAPTAPRHGTAGTPPQHSTWRRLEGQSGPAPKPGRPRTHARRRHRHRLSYHAGTEKVGVPENMPPPDRGPLFRCAPLGGAHEPLRDPGRRFCCSQPNGLPAARSLNVALEMAPRARMERARGFVPPGVLGSKAMSMCRVRGEW